MKKLLILFCLVLASNAYAQSGEWHLMRDEIRAYRVDFPKAPEAKTQAVPTALGDLEMHYYMLDLSTSDPTANNLVYMSAFTEYPEGESDYGDESLQQSMLDGSVNGAVSRVNGELISQERIKINGFNGRMAKISIYNNQYIINLQNVLVDNKLYFLQVICNSGAGDNAEMKRFFKSFDLIKMR